VVLCGTPLSNDSVAPIAQTLERRGFNLHVPAFNHPCGSVAATRERLIQWLDERGVTNFAVVGHSFGAYRAFDLALNRARERVHAIVALGPLVGVPEEASAPIEALARHFENGEDVSSLLTDRWYSAAFRRSHANVQHKVSKWCLDQGPDVAAAHLREYLTGELLLERMAEINCPVQLLVGEDVATPPTWARAIHERLPDSQLFIVPFAGHMVFEEQPKTIDRIIEFLK